MQFGWFKETALERIFAEFLAGRGIFAIAEGLTRDGIPSRSAHDPARNTHRSGIAWSKGGSYSPSVSGVM